jgi:hypothetical protein
MNNLDEYRDGKAMDIISLATLDQSDNDFIMRLRIAAAMKFIDFYKEEHDREPSDDELSAHGRGFTSGIAVAKMLDKGVTQ